jgi:DNA-binding transcriptional regulator YbjK
MHPKKTAFAAVLSIAVLLAAVTLYAQESAGQKRSEVFCSAKKTGQLCNHGTADLLKLSGSKRDRWTEMAKRYNERVEAAAQDLLKEAKTHLSPEEVAQVETWLDKARNAELNKLLAGK